MKVKERERNSKIKEKRWREEKKWYDQHVLRMRVQACAMCERKCSNKRERECRSVREKKESMN